MSTTRRAGRVNRFAFTGQLLLAAFAVSMSTNFAGAQNLLASSADAKPEIPASKIAEATILHELHETISELRQVSVEIINEIHRRQTDSASDPDEIKLADVAAVPQSTGSVAGALPPRAKWMKMYMWQFDQLMPMLKDEVNSAEMPADTKAKINPKWQEMNPLVDDIKTHYQQLVTVVQTKPTENASISKEVTPIYEDLKKLQDIQKEIWQMANKS